MESGVGACPSQLLDNPARRRRGWQEGFCLKESVKLSGWRKCVPWTLNVSTEYLWEVEPQLPTLSNSSMPSQGDKTEGKRVAGDRDLCRS